GGGGGGRDGVCLLDLRGRAGPPPPRRRQVVFSPPAVSARADHRRRGDLLVHRRGDAGGEQRRLPRRGVHQGEHPPRYRCHQGVGRRQQEGGRDLHAVRAAGDVQHLPHGVLLPPHLPLPHSPLLHQLP